MNAYLFKAESLQDFVLVFNPASRGEGLTYELPIKMKGKIPNPIQQANLLNI